MTKIERHRQAGRQADNEVNVTLQIQKNQKKARFLLLEF